MVALRSIAWAMEVKALISLDWVCRGAVTMPIDRMGCGSSSGIKLVSSRAPKALSHDWATTLDQRPVATWEAMTEMEFVSICGSATAPASWKMRSNIYRFSISGLSRQSGVAVVSAQLTLVLPWNGPVDGVSRK